MELKTQTISREALMTAVLVGAATLAPLLHSQLVTGTIVNATLFLAAMSLGFGTASAIALFPSLIALAVGTLPPAMAPLVPLIIVSNVVLVAVFMLLKRYSFARAAVLASLAKFLFLVSFSATIIRYFEPGMPWSALSSMIGWPQLITALSGAAVAYFIVARDAKSI